MCEADDRGEKSWIRFPDPDRQDFDAARREERRAFPFSFCILHGSLAHMRVDYECSLGTQRIQADDGSEVEVDESARSSHPESPTDEGEGDGDGNGDGDGEGDGEEDDDGGMDLDAELEDMDEDVGNTTAETDDFDEMDSLEVGELDE